MIAIVCINAICGNVKLTGEQQGNVKAEKRLV